LHLHFESVKNRHSKLLLEFATLSVIESLRTNPELCNFVLNDISNNTTSYGSNYLSLTLPGQQQQQSFRYISDDDICTAVILEESEKLYNELITKLTNSVIAV
jgi:hypothetical protein